MIFYLQKLYYLKKNQLRLNNQLGPDKDLLLCLLTIILLYYINYKFFNKL